MGIPDSWCVFAKMTMGFLYTLRLMQCPLLKMFACDLHAGEAGSLRGWKLAIGCVIRLDSVSVSWHHVVIKGILFLRN